MNHRAIWARIALLALLSSGCQQCQVGRNIADYYHPEPPKEPVASEAPVPGNAFSSIANNRFSFKEFNAGPRVDMPLKTKQAEEP